MGRVFLIGFIRFSFGFQPVELRHRSRHPRRVSECLGASVGAAFGSAVC